MYWSSLRRSRTIFERHERQNNVIEQQRAWATIGRTKFMQNKLDDAKKAHELALHLTNKLRDKVSEKEFAEMKCRAYLNLALIYDQRELINEGSQYYSKAIQLSLKYGLKETLHRCQNSLALFFQKLEYYSRAMQMFDQAIKTAKLLKSKIFICEYQLAKGYLMILLKDYQGARTYFKKAYYTKTPSEDDQEKASRYLKLATDVLKCLKALDRTKDAEEKLQIFDKLGDIFVEFEAYKNAIEYYEQELTLAKELEKSGAELAAIYVSLAQTYLDDKQYDNAIDYFNEEIKYRQGNAHEAVRTMLKIIEANVEKGSSEEEIDKLYKDALELAGETTSVKRKVLLDYRSYAAQLDDQLKFNEIESEIALLGEDEATQPTNSNSEQCTPTNENDQDAAFRLSDISDPSSDSDDEEERDTERTTKTRASRMGSKLAKRNEMGETPLHRACISGNAKEVRKLLDKNHPTDIRDHCGWLPIHEAANHGHDGIVEMLIDAGSPVNDRGGDKCDGMTPLHDACTNAYPKVIRVLMRRGANVAALDNQGNTPLDCLRIWRTRVEEINSEEEEIYNQLVDELKDAMRKVGVDPDKERERPLIDASASTLPDRSNTLTERNKRVRAPLRRRGTSSPTDMSPPPKRPPQTKASSNSNIRTEKSSTSNLPGIKKRMRHSDDELLDERGSVDEYTSAISNLRRQKDPSADPSTNCIRSTDSTTANNNAEQALQNEENAFVRDWLVDDLGTNRSKERSTRDLYNSRHLPTKYREPSSNVSKNKSRDAQRTKKGNTSSKRMAPVRNDARRNDNRDEIAEHDTVYQTIEENSDNSNDTHFGVNSEPIRRHNQRQTMTKRPTTTVELVSQETRNDAPESMKAETILIRVHIDQSQFLIKLPDPSKKIEWLAQETVSRYYQLKKVKPVIHLTTMDGALLSNDDLIKEVLTEYIVLAQITSIEVTPLHQRYRELCIQTNTFICNDIEMELQSCEESGILDLSNGNICSNQWKMILETIKDSTNVYSIDISFTWLDQMKLFLDTLGTLKQLDKLHLCCCGITRANLSSLSRLKLNISHLDLGFNPFSNDYLPILCDVIANFPSLRTIKMVSCDLDVNFYKEELLVSAVKRSKLIDLYVEKDIALDDTLAAFYNNILKF